ncbi:deoxynucleoside kinase, partial [Myxococcota bacterium]|nr:deoxynucleoside kinase [Myxococcota bacterium]
ITHHELIETVPKSCIQDRSLLEDPEIFAKYLHGLGHMTDNELDLYLEYFERLNRGIRQPDRIIYLQCQDTDTLLSRIQSRGRKEEQSIPEDFLAGLNGYYQALPSILKSKYKVPTMIFDVTQFNVHNEAQAEAFLTLAKAFIENSDI